MPRKGVLRFSRLVPAANAFFALLVTTLLFVVPSVQEVGAFQASLVEADALAELEEKGEIVDIKIFASSEEEFLDQACSSLILIVTDVEEVLSGNSGEWRESLNELSAQLRELSAQFPSDASAPGDTGELLTNLSVTVSKQQTSRIGQPSVLTLSEKFIEPLLERCGLG